MMLVKRSEQAQIQASNGIKTEVGKYYEVNYVNDKLIQKNKFSRTSNNGLEFS